ncbi:uncharacterized protein LOC131930110 isoform X1 [Physella acuta]|uniref:uncharacterized protein LOC131930110 isoform X1 n=1 Tax=Physella acuta TaxID=109671 RepID=UPI0027DC54DC|nr:uncharacterized protein LOC131930110 isoform X1 [Physella acuta]XP_059142465.1 uncharacterized protein LOC131930110 isoform X1 [Physella acuta]XP_059142466.1 uncharacterized protein LOC131930110 isoform X1 [Physella acuta]XP_059142467.1 uncharacterized protein LOC131930110 isoform X1 [Physella acuta]
MLLPTSVHGVEFIVTFLFFCGVVSSSVVQEKCNDLKPVVCPTYGMCCTADQFCSENSGTCESCFPEAFTKREERLKFCSDLERKRTNSSMRHYTCKAACVTLFNMTEIMSYVDKPPEKTAKELIADHNSSMHEHLEGSVVKRIDDNRRRVSSLENEVSNLKLADDNQRSVTSLEDEVSSLKLAAILILVLTLIAIVIGVAFYGFWRRRVSKMKKQTDVRERKKLLDDDVEKKLNKAFD